MLLSVANLAAGYGSAPVVWDIDIEVDSGEVVALLGPNGAGKTTILLAIMGVIECLKGTVAFAGRLKSETRTADMARAGAALVPDDRGLLGSLSVRDNLSLVRDPKRDPLELFPELKPLMRRQVRLLSGGEQQMLALARAFASEPRLLLVDEMSQGLAPVIVQRLLPLLRSAAEEWGAGVLLVEQDVAGALKVADRGYLLRHGRIAISGRAEDLLTKQDVLETAYLGSS